MTDTMPVLVIVLLVNGCSAEIDDIRAQSSAVASATDLAAADDDLDPPPPPPPPPPGPPDPCAGLPDGTNLGCETGTDADGYPARGPLICVGGRSTVQVCSATAVPVIT